MDPTWICGGLFAAVGVVYVALRLRRPRSTGAERQLDGAGPVSDEIEIDGKYRSRCTTCRETCAPGDRIFWHRRLRTVRHVDCAAGVKTRRRDALAIALDKVASGGPGTRKAAVATALEQLPPGSQERGDFLVEVARLEVMATLDKVDSLKSFAAKRRHLNAALQRLAEDEVPDELQAEQFQWLRDALASLDGYGK